MKNQKIYKGMFNLHGQVFELYRSAPSLASAKNFMIRHIAKEVGMRPQIMSNYFNGSKDNYRIEEMTNAGRGSA